MGSCISKCRPKRHSLEEFNHVQDKAVISQATKTSIPHSNKISPCPPSPTASTSSVSSPTCTINNTTSSSSSLSSSSSVLSAKDRSFSNEFLWSCIKENPHVVRIHSLRENAILLASSRVHVRKSDLVAKPMVAPAKQSIPEKNAGSTSQKRFRSGSPTPLPRQKSFRREPDGPNPAYSIPSRALRSPSPSRRYNGDRFGPVLTNPPTESHSKRMVGSKAGTASSVPTSLRKESFRSASPNNNLSRPRPYFRNRETTTHRIGSKIDEVSVGKALSDYDIEAIPLEDINNPLISLDCFIFL